MTGFDKLVDDINAALFKSKGYKQFNGEWYKPIYYWEDWSNDDFSQGGCIAAQRERTGLNAWRALHSDKAILEQEGKIIREFEAHVKMI